MNIVEQINQETIENMGKNVPSFHVGDTVRVHVKVVEGNRERLQPYEGVVIARKNDGLNSAFTVRKLSFGEGVERIFPLYSPIVEKIDVIRKGDVRRAKLYYLRGRTGKSARITEKSLAERRLLAEKEAKRQAGLDAIAQEKADAKAKQDAAKAEAEAKEAKAAAAAEETATDTAAEEAKTEETKSDA